MMRALFNHRWLLARLGQGPLGRLSLLWRTRRLPSRLLLLVTGLRTGSTWLTDALRCHPAISFWPEATLYQLLELNGRRYPADLSGSVTGDGRAGRRIEVRPLLWDDVPVFDASGRHQTAVVPAYALEKLHPHYFEHDVERFVGRLATLAQRGVEVRPLYQVRDPAAALASFRQYQQRNPRWYPQLTGARLARFWRDTYGTLAELAGQQPGLVVDYGQMKADPAPTLEKVHRYLWPEAGTAARDRWPAQTAAAVAATDRRRRPATPFLGVKGAPEEQRAERIRPFFTRHADLLAEAAASYRQLVARRNAIQ